MSGDTADGSVVDNRATTYVVTGTVSSPDSASVGGLALQLVDKNVGAADDVVARGETLPTGGFTLTAEISAEQLRQRRKTQADLQVLVLDGDATLASSIVRWNASPTEELDVSLPTGLSTLPSEYETLTAAISQHYGGALGELQEGAARQDITYLANKTGWDARAIAMNVQAAQLSQQPLPPAPAAGGTPNAEASNGSVVAPGLTPGDVSTAVDPAFYYALLRAGLPMDPVALHQTPLSHVSAVWDQATTQGVIPRALAAQTGAALQHFQAIAAGAVLTAAPSVGPSTMSDLLTTVFGDDNVRKQQFANLYVGNGADSKALWNQVEQTFGSETSAALQLDGQLGYLTLNNAPLIAALHDAQRQQPIAAPSDLAAHGYYDAAAWSSLLANVDPPAQVPGDTPVDQKAAYAELLAAQVRLSFPTGSVAGMISTGALQLGNNDVQPAVAEFLTEHQSTFDIGAEPIARYLARTGTTATSAVVEQVTRVQRVYQITPNSQAMTALISQNLDSAYAVTRFGQGAFVREFAESLGGADVALSTYTQARMVHASVLSVTLSYLSAKTAPTLGSGVLGTLVNPLSGWAELEQSSQQSGTAPVFAQATLDDLFGQLDYCSCDDCQSILGPAAYLVDLLHYIDCSPTASYSNPQDVLLTRRPDIGALPLTCDNTNVALPYLDLVNETLEYYVGQGLTIAGYPGHNTDGTVSSAELNASPQNDDDTTAQSAYATLKTAWFPGPLPFHRELELLRQHVGRLQLTLADLMRVLRVDETLQSPPPADPNSYGWCDILAERLGFSRLEYRLLTDSTLTLQQIYGYTSGTDVVAKMSVLQEFSRRTGVSYADVVSILQTVFVNPDSVLIPLLLDLAVSPETLQQLQTNAITATQFASLLPAGLDPTRYGPSSETLEDVAAWVIANYARIMGLIVIDVNGAASDTTMMQLQYLNPDTSANALQPIDFVRLARFIRLWQKLGLTIQQTDDLITALFASTDPSTDTDLQKLDSGMLTMLPRAGLVYEVMDLLGLDASDDLDSILPCWGVIGTAGPDSLYARMFLNPTVLSTSNVFAPAQDGSILQTLPAPLLLDHASELCAALNLTQGEFDLITGTSGAPLVGLGLHYDASTPLTTSTITEIYRRAWLARTLQLSVLELLSLSALTGIDPFALPVLDNSSPVTVPMLDFVKLVQALSTANLAPVQALYLLWNVDLSGVSAPDPSVITALAATLRTAFGAVDSQFAVTAEASLDSAKSLMALVLGATATNLFFGLLTQTFTTSVPFGYDQSTLPEAVLAAGGGQLSYDDLAKQLTVVGYLGADALAALLTAATGDGALIAGITALAAANAAAVNAFFATYDDPGLGLQILFTAYTSSPDPTVKGSVSTLLDTLIPVLGQRRKQQQALAAVTAVAGCDPSFAPALLDDSRLICAAQNSASPGVDDLVTAGLGGLSVSYFYGNDPTNPSGPDLSLPLVSNLIYGPTNPLRPSADSGSAAFAASWSGYLSAPQSGDINIHIAVDPGVVLEVSIGGEPVIGALDPSNVWGNTAAIELTAGTPTKFSITAKNLTSTFALTWQSLGTGWQPIPASALFGDAAINDLNATYLRFLKATSLASDLSLTAVELSYLATSPQLTVGGHGWLSGLAVTAPASAADFGDLTRLLRALLTFTTLKARFAPTDTRFLDAISAVTGAADTTKLQALTGWDATSIAVVTARLFGGVTLPAIADIVSALGRLAETFDVIGGCGVTASTLIAATTNDPAEATVQALQAALRSRLAESDWLAAVMPINNALREMQRDALVAYILVQVGDAILAELGVQATVNRVATADDLFNYFLMDVEMQPCMESSRILHALSAVQLFIERCLRNLEPLVNPGDIEADEWPWRKRYRVWQANREVFLWPENWLDPSLRDDQSSIFKTTMSQLLQSDITDDTAASAYLDYLSNLEQVAKLETCGLYHQPADGTNDEITHAISRSAGAHRKHYYRNYSGGSWTPWQEIKLQIEDHPVVPYVWNGRLMLFWLQLHQRPGITPSNIGGALPQDNTKQLADAHMKDISGQLSGGVKTMTASQLGAVLCFSEYYNGAWQPIKTSDIKTPLDLDDGTSGQPFDRTTLVLRAWSATDSSDDSLYLQVTTRDQPPVSGWLYSWIGDDWRTGGGFVLHNTHSAPLRWTDVKPQAVQVPSQPRQITTPAGASGWGATLQAQYGTSAYGSLGAALGFDFLGSTPFDILTGKYPQTVRPSQPGVDSQWQMPFFFEDSRNAFYVTTSTRLVTFGGYRGYGLVAGSGSAAFSSRVKIPNIVVAKGPVQPGDPIDFTRILGDPDTAQNAFADSAGMHAVIGSGATLMFQGREIGATGSTVPIAVTGGNAPIVIDGGTAQLTNEHDIAASDEGKA